VGHDQCAWSTLWCVWVAKTRECLTESPPLAKKKRKSHQGNFIGAKFSWFLVKVGVNNINSLTLMYYFLWTTKTTKINPHGNFPPYGTSLDKSIETYHEKKCHTKKNPSCKVQDRCKETRSPMTAILKQSSRPLVCYLRFCPGCYSIWSKPQRSGFLYHVWLLRFCVGLCELAAQQLHLQAYSCFQIRNSPWSWLFAVL
jgi:hypothetical protein